MAPELVLLAVGLTLWMVGMSTAPSEDDMQSIAHDPKRPDEAALNITHTYARSKSDPLMSGWGY